MPRLEYRFGRVFDDRCDLAVLPCSTEGTVNSLTQETIARYHLPSPEPKHLGEVQIESLGGENKLANFLAWAASVESNSSSEKAIEQIGRRIGEFTREVPNVRLVHCPVLGINAGKLDLYPAVDALSKGFRATARNDATLVILSPDPQVAARLSIRLPNDIPAPTPLKADDEAEGQTRYPRKLTESQKEELDDAFKVYRRVVASALLAGTMDSDKFGSAYATIRGFEGIGLNPPEWFKQDETLEGHVEFVRGRLSGIPPSLAAVNMFLADEFKAFFIKSGLAGVASKMESTSSSEAGSATGPTQPQPEIWLYAQPRNERDREGLEQMQKVFLYEGFVVGDLSKERLGELESTLSQPNKDHIYPVIVLDAHRMAPALVSPRRANRLKGKKKSQSRRRLSRNQRLRTSHSLRVKFNS